MKADLICDTSNELGVYALNYILNDCDYGKKNTVLITDKFELAIREGVRTESMISEADDPAQGKVVFSTTRKG